MLFKLELCEAILAGRKTQTRRVEKPGDVELYDQKVIGGKIVDYIRAVVRNGRVLWEVGRTYAIQPGRGKKAVGRFLLTDIRQEQLRDISEEDAEAEGFPFYDTWRILSGIRFAEYWDTIHKPGERWEDDPEVWVLTMEMSDG